MSGSGRPGRLLDAPGNRRRRGMVVARGAGLAYRTRLTGRRVDEGARRGQPVGPRQFMRIPCERLLRPRPVAGGQGDYHDPPVLSAPTVTEMLPNLPKS